MWCVGARVLGTVVLLQSFYTRSQGKWSDMCLSSPIAHLSKQAFPSHPPANWQKREREDTREDTRTVPYRSYSAQLYPIVDMEVHSTTHTRIKTPNYTHTTSTDYTLRYIHSRSDAGRDGAGCEKCLFVRGWVEQEGGESPGQKREEAYLCSTIHCRSFVPLSTPRTLPPSHTAASFLSLTSSTAGICRSGTRLVGWYFGGEYSLYDTDKYYSADDTCLFPPLLPYSQLTLMLISALLTRSVIVLSDTLPRPPLHLSTSISRETAPHWLDWP